MSNPPVTQMAREIAEQPDAVRRTLAALLPQRQALRSLGDGRRRVLFVARGSSVRKTVLTIYSIAIGFAVLGGAIVFIRTRYAIAVYHDLDSDGQLARNLLNIPTEPFGFGNDAVVRFSQPGFEATATTVSGPLTRTSVTLN